MASWRWAWMAGVVGCGGEPPATDWSLALTPTVHPNQDPFKKSPEIKLVLRRASGDEVHALGEATPDGLLTLPDLPAAEDMADVTALGLAVEDPGGASDAIDDNRLLAYGEAAFDGVTPGGSATTPVLVSELDAVGDLGKLSANQKRYLRAAAVVPPGRVFLFGGATDLGSTSTPSAVTSDIFELADLDAGDPWDFENVGALPNKGSPPARLGATATAVDVDGKPMILVVGGRADLWVVSPSYDNWFLYDPDALDVVDSGHLTTGRSEHVAALMSDGRVFVVGGWTGNSFDNADADIIDPVAGKVTFVDLDLPAHSGQGAASLGTAGVLVCGGFFSTASGVATMYPDCQIVNLQGTARDSSPLPIPLARFAMVPLSEGRVLVTGGFSIQGQFNDLDAGAATDTAFLYDLDTDRWIQLHPMNIPRSSPGAIPLSHDRALIVGGVSSDGIYLLPTGLVDCPELFDASTGSFTILEDQCGWGGGAMPAIGTWPGVGTVFLPGFTVPGEDQGPVGFVGSGPA